MLLGVSMYAMAAKVVRFSYSVNEHVQEHIIVYLERFVGIFSFWCPYLLFP